MNNMQENGSYCVKLVIRACDVVQCQSSEVICNHVSDVNADDLTAPLLSWLNENMDGCFQATGLLGIHCSCLARTGPDGLFQWPRSAGETGYQTSCDAICLENLPGGEKRDVSPVRVHVCKEKPEFNDT